MKTEISKRIEEITLDFTSQKSIVDSTGEIEMADKLYGVMAGIDYYKKNPEKLYFLPIKNDSLGRKIVIAELNGEKKKSDKTVVLIGHFDTVGISDYGSLQEYATKPAELAKRLGELKLPPEVREDLESGEYLFGRGVFDMKSGDATIIALMEDISKDIKNFEGNIIFGAVCDEEGNSAGMLNFVPKLNKLKKEKNYEYLAIIDTDYMAPAYPGDPTKYVYVGTVGKLMPTFFVVGKETHVGESYDGLDPNQIVAEITRRVNLNPEFCDVAGGEVTLPPVTLKQRDLKPEYSVQLAKTSILLFNFATHVMTPDQVLEKMKDVGQECFVQVVDEINARYKKYCGMIGREYRQQPWVARTMTYDELYANVKAEIGVKLDIMIADFLESIKDDKSLDVREKQVKVVEYLHNIWSDQNPVVIVFFSAPYYPHIYVEGTRDKEKALIEAVTDAIKTTAPKFDYKLIQKKFLPCISDLSYAAAPKDPEVVEKFKINTPGYGVVYDLPIEDMQNLDLPVVDIGSFGKDAHKYSERVEKRYSFQVNPELVYKTIMNLLK